ncbi:MAG: type pilus assembly protein PilC [Solirubrobacteraceae bacterium]|jgi:type IV pilus assembly protein PilC|nr:type pilus assembly protein PilC [Solirubrobacteraceae bacterium]MEA2181209.1 type pilus assembly protein PilC [Solirubrobacteraceae bacterium]MEA2186755.1 type pilus assembly protein PilC [Solirubrobacteraceae bacterium]
MSTFVFKAIDLRGQQAKGEVEADNKQSVADQLKAKGLIVLDIADKQKAAGIELPWANRIKLGDLSILTRQLATMVSSGMTILRSLYVLEAQTENKKLAAQLVLVRKDVEAGLPLSDALERHPKTFGPLVVAMVRAGETGGVLEESLLRIADQLEKEESLRRQVKSAMAYPIVILTFAMIVMLGMVAFIVPVFAGVFKELGNAKMPAMTQFVMGISNVVTGYWYALIAGSVGVVFGFFKWKKTPRGRAVWQRFLLRVPFKIGDIFQKVALARWSRTFSALMGAGVPLLQAIDITSQTAGNIVVEEAMANVTTSVKAGGTIAQPLMDSPVFPSMVGHMVKVGEETGALTTMLTKIGDFYEDQVSASVKALTSILEPVMIVFVGGIVGFIVIAMYLPLFSVYDQIK